MEKGPYVYLPQPVLPEAVDYLTEHGYTLLHGNGTFEERHLAICDAILLRTLPFDGSVLARAPRLRVVSKNGVGVDSIDVDACTRRGVYVTNTPEANYISVAEQTMLLMLGCARQLYAVTRFFRNETPDFHRRDAYPGRELCGKTLAIVGCGRIGRRVAELALAFGMRVLGYDPYLPPERFPVGVERLETLEEAFRQGDYVSLHIPGSVETRGLIGKEHFALMKPTAYFLNLARGSLVREDELIEALRTGVIAGAGLDVFAQEPVPGDNPLLTMENVLATPHAAADTTEALTRMALTAARSIDQALSGRRPDTAVNQPVGL